MHFSELLNNSLSSDQNIRQQATLALENASSSNFTQYVQLMCQELSNEVQQSHIRTAAGVAIKNSLISKDPIKKKHLIERWLSLNREIRQNLKSLIIQSLGVKDPSVGTTVAQVIASISNIELPNNEWPELTQILLQNVTQPISPSQLKKSTLESIGFICEDLDPSILATKSNEILTAVIQGARKEEPNASVRKAAINALLNSLEFIRANFDNDNERNIIMQVVCEATQSSDESVSVAAFECLVGIMTLYYDYMASYMNHGLFKMTIDSMKHPVEKIALQAIEFWSTVCDEEIDRQISIEESNTRIIFYDFARSAIDFVVPSLLYLLTRQETEDDEDEWNVSKAAGTCLALFSNCTQDDILKSDNAVFPFVESNIVSTDWRHREAAVMAFASILDGPKFTLIEPYVKQALPQLIKMMSDPSIAVKDTTAWAIGRISEILHHAIDPAEIPALVNVLLVGLKDLPRVASHCACSLTNLAIQMGDEDPAFENCVLSPYFQQTVSELLIASQREDGEESNLRSLSFQALSNVILYTAKETFPTIIQLTDIVLTRLQHPLTLQNQNLSQEDTIRLSDFQSHYCSVLQNIIRKLGKDIIPFSDRIMTVFLQILNFSSSSRYATIYEDIFLAIGSLISELESDFDRYLPHFYPKLIEAIQNHAEFLLCSIAVGIVGDLARALNKELTPFCDQLMKFLLEAIQDPLLDRSVKPHVISAFGDIAIAIGKNYKGYLKGVLILLEQASASDVDRDNVDQVDYLNELRESILEAYTCIVQGMKSDHMEDELLPYVDAMLHFVNVISTDESKTETVARNAIGLLGDLSDTFKLKLKQQFQLPWVKPFIKDYRKSENHTESTVSIANWAYKMINQT